MILKLWKCIPLLLLIGIGRVNATETKPWLGNVFEFEFRPSLTYQGYTRLSSGSKAQKYSSSDLFLNVSLSNALPSFGLEIEVLGARTRRQRSDVDQVKMTGRYVWRDDIAGDPLSIVSGLSFIQAFHPSLKDVSSFHHGISEAELFLSVGKEYPQDTVWVSRWWSVFGIGAAAHRGSPWFRLNMAYEKCFCGQHELRLLLNTLWGTGHQRLHLHHFNGYGPVQHQSVDLGFRYTHLLEFFGNASLEYSYRVHARNFPEYTHRVTAQILYTFGL